MRLGKGIRVILGRQQHDFHFHPLLQDHIDSADGSLYAGGISVVDDCYLVGETFYQRNLSDCEGRAGRCHDVLYPCLMHRNHIGIAFHEKAVVLAGNR